MLPCEGIAGSFGSRKEMERSAKNELLDLTGARAASQICSACCCSALCACCSRPVSSEDDLLRDAREIPVT